MSKLGMRSTNRSMHTSSRLVEFVIILLVFVLEMNCMQYDDGALKKGIEYQWRVAKWKPCNKVKTCDEPGIQRGSLTCVNSKFEKVSSRNCHRGTRPRRRKICVADECLSQTKFVLKYQPWSNCSPENLSKFDIPNIIDRNITIEEKRAANNSSEKGFKRHRYMVSNWKRIVLDSCGSFENSLIYVKRREATCTAHWSNKNANVETALEHCITRTHGNPVLIKLCSFGCKQTCSVGIWMAWERSPFLPKHFRFRTRAITFFPYRKNRTDICPSLIDLSVLNAKPSSTVQGQFEISAWGPCVKTDRHFSGGASEEPRSIKPIVGVQTRVLKCVRINKAKEKCHDVGTKSFARSQLCILPRDCRVSEWSDWSACDRCHFNENTIGKIGSSVSKEIYKQRRTRTIEIISISKGKPCPPLTEIRTCDPSTTPFLDLRNRTAIVRSYLWFTGDFGKCKPDARDCRSGTKSRSVFCVRSGDVDHKPVSPRFCVLKSKPTEVVFCRNHCQETCVLGEWSSWSGCTADCTPGKPGVVRGTHYRVRRVIQYSGDPNACADYAESRPCALQNCVSWFVGPQTICLMDNIHRACGNGKTDRAVYCMNARGQQVNESVCKGEMPSKSLPCHVPCSDDCVLGIWSSWGSCHGQCNLNGTQGSTYRSRTRRIRANPGWSGRSCPDQSKLTERESCLGESCGTYHWIAGAWGSCRVRGLSKDRIKPQCAVGEVHRPVHCVNKVGIKVNEYLCNTFLKPRRSKVCRRCSYDCVMSSWSEWSACPMKCTWSRKHSQRKRERFVVRSGTGTGRECPSNLRQFEKCDSCNDYEWKYSNWSNCLVVSKGDCAGLRTRLVQCFQSIDSTVHWDGHCLAKIKKPKEYELCTHKGCNESCILTQWSEWGRCSKKCETGFARRTRDIIGNRADCASIEKLDEERPCNTHQCGKYSLRIGKWSRCYAVDTKTNCGVGRQWRNVNCFKTSGSETALQYCIEELYAGQMTLQFERNCNVRCPLDCKLSSWTSYTPCSRKCGSGVKRRFRTIVQKATHGGHVCVADDSGQQITETIPCMESQCYNYVWKASPWSACTVTNQTKGRVTKCGTGIQRRNVYCTDSRFSGRKSIINDTFCDPKERPSLQDACTLYCPGDCVVGEWTLWSKCSSACPKPGHRKRERTILRYPAHDGKGCAALEQNERCNLKECFNHYWRPTEWSSCLFYQADTSCGIGRQRRMADCGRTDSKIMHPFFCRIEGRRLPTLLRMCTVPCPKNCEISEWAAWSSCQDECNVVAMQRRSRFVLAPAKNGGQSCLESEALQEIRSCPMKPCFKVETDKWDTCRPLMDKACGFGTKGRSLNCVRDDGKIVDRFHCPQLTEENYPKEIQCRIPCIGDCILTEWSVWSSCFASCTVKNHSMFDYGTRIRTRHVLRMAEKFGERCPLNLVESERCNEPKCFTFSWKTGPYIDKKRGVWCERSDGVKVANGCDMGYKPSASQTCEPACSVSNSFCNSETVCTCKKNFIPIFSSHGYLLHCLSESNSFKNGSNEVVAISSKRGKGTSWLADLPIIIWVVIGVCFIYLLLFLAIVIVYTRRRKSSARERRTETVDVGTLTNPERIPLTERGKGHERTGSKTSFATSSGRGSTVSTFGDQHNGEQWPEPPDDVVSEFIRQHLKNFNKGSFSSAFSDESLPCQDRVFVSTTGTNCDASGTL